MLADVLLVLSHKEALRLSHLGFHSAAFRREAVEKRLPLFCGVNLGALSRLLNIEFLLECVEV